MSIQDSYTIKIQQFEGPFDLLLFFIERDEIDIHHIPISKITEDFLSYIRQLEKLNINVASEFILMAARLMQIKAKMLLPRKDINEEGEEIDPRQEIAQKLIEYKKFKSTIEHFRNLESERSSKHVRGSLAKDLDKIAQKALVDIELESLSLYRLFKVFNNSIANFDSRMARPTHKVVNYPYTIESQERYILSKLKQGNSVDFEMLFSNLENIFHAIITFLALLEMVGQQRVTIFSNDIENSLMVNLV